MKQRGGFLLLVFLFIINLVFISCFASAGTLKVTEEHPFLVEGKWIQANELKLGDKIQTLDGKKVRITSIEDVETKEPFPVYNLEAEVYHDFVVDGGDGLGVVVHNSNKPSMFDIYPKTPKSEVDKMFSLTREVYGSGSSEAYVLQLLDGEVVKISLTPEQVFSFYERGVVPKGNIANIFQFRKPIITDGLSSAKLKRINGYALEVESLPFEVKLDLIYKKLKLEVATDLRSSDHPLYSMNSGLSCSQAVCRHQAYILREALKNGGIDSRIVSVTSHSGGFFGNHARLEVFAPDGSSFYMDPTWYITPTKLPASTSPNFVVLYEQLNP